MWVPTVVCGSSSSSSSSSSCGGCCWQRVRLPAARGGAISLLAFCSPGIELWFCFRIGFCGVFQQKCDSRRAALYKNMLSSPFRIFFPVFSCVCVCVAFRIGFYSIFGDSRLSAHAGFDLHLSFSSVRGWGGGMGRGVMTSMRMRLVSCVSFVAFYVCRISHRFFYGVFALDFVHMPAKTCICLSALCGVGGGWGGGVMTSMRMRLVSSVSFVALLLKCCRLLCEALVAASCCFTFETSAMQNFEFLKLSRQKLRNLPPPPQIIKHKRRKKHGICDNFAKTYPKNKTKTLWTPQIRNINLLTKTTQNSGLSSFSPKNRPKINDTPRAAADARATFLSSLCCCCCRSSLTFFERAVVVRGVRQYTQD